MLFISVIITISFITTAQNISLPRSSKPHTSIWYLPGSSKPREDSRDERYRRLDSQRHPHCHLLPFLCFNTGVTGNQRGGASFPEYGQTVNIINSKVITPIETFRAWRCSWSFKVFGFVVVGVTVSLSQFLCICFAFRAISCLIFNFTDMFIFTWECTHRYGVSVGNDVSQYWLRLLPVWLNANLIPNTKKHEYTTVFTCEIVFDVWKYSCITFLCLVVLKQCNFRITIHTRKFYCIVKTFWKQEDQP